jgi:hypothetical protein
MLIAIKIFSLGGDPLSTSDAPYEHRNEQYISPFYCCFYELKNLGNIKNMFSYCCDMNLRMAPQRMLDHV